MGSACWAVRIKDPEVAAKLAARDPSDAPAAPSIEGFGWLEATLSKMLDRLAQIAYGTVRADPGLAPTEPWPDYPHLALREASRRAGRADMNARLYPGRG